jgi:hypothetical protein
VQTHTATGQNSWTTRGWVGHREIRSINLLMRTKISDLPKEGIGLLHKKAIGGGVGLPCEGNNTRHLEVGGKMPWPKCPV